jgi:hypothetical protein
MVVHLLPVVKLRESLQRGLHNGSVRLRHPGAQDSPSTVGKTIRQYGHQSTEPDRQPTSKEFHEWFHERLQRPVAEGAAIRRCTRPTILGSISFLSASSTPGDSDTSTGVMLQAIHTAPRLAAGTGADAKSTRLLAISLWDTTTFSRWVAPTTSSSAMQPILTVGSPRSVRLFSKAFKPSSIRTRRRAGR